MPNPVFPPSLAPLQDSKYFKIDLEDKGLKGEVDGGYVNARPRHTRKPRKTFKTGFTELTQTQMDTLEAFFELVGTYSKFDYTHPIKGTVHQVRFDKGLTMTYQGAGLLRLWTVSEIELKEV